MKITGVNFLKLVIIIFIILMILITSLIYINLNKTTIYSGVRVNGVEVGGLNKSQGIEKLNREIQEKLDIRALKIASEDYVYKARYKDMDISYDYYKGINNAYLVGREGSLFNKLKDIYKAKREGINIKIDLLYEDSSIEKIIKDVEKDIFRKSEDATIKYEKGVFKVTPEVIGRKVNGDLLKERIIKSLPNDSLVEIPIENDVPNITEGILSEIKYPVSQFTTAFYSSSDNRVRNIKLAASKIDGKVILPGEVFSFNKSTGPRDEESGYRESNVILNGEFVSDIGGGVCQVSTTLYNAALLSDLEIVERHNHSIPVGYVPKGHDATVSYDYLDLKIKNNYEFPIYIYGGLKGKALTFKFFGGKINNKKTIQILSKLEETIKPKIDSTIDSTLSPGQRIVVRKGRNGYKVKTYKITYKDGKEVNRELLSDDYYKPQKEVVRVGPDVKSSKDSGILVP